MNNIFSDLIKKKIDEGHGNQIGWIFKRNKDVERTIRNADYYKNYEDREIEYSNNKILFEDTKVSFNRMFEIILEKKLELLEHYQELKNKKYFLIIQSFATFYDQIALFIAAFELGLNPVAIPNRNFENKVREFFGNNEVKETELCLLSSGVTGKEQLKIVPIERLFQDSKLDIYLRNNIIYVYSDMYYVTGMLYNLISPIKNNSISYIPYHDSYEEVSNCNFLLLTPEKIIFYYMNKIQIDGSKIKKIYIVGSQYNDKMIQKVRNIFVNLEENAILFAYASTENGIISITEEKDFKYHEINGINCLSCGKIGSKNISISSSGEININDQKTGDYGKIYDNYLYVLGKHNEEIELESQLSYKYNCQCLVYKDNDELVPVFEIWCMEEPYKTYKKIIEEYPNSLFVYRFKRHSSMKKVLKKDMIDFCKQNPDRCNFMSNFLRTLENNLMKNYEIVRNKMLYVYNDDSEMNRMLLDFDFEEISNIEFSYFDKRFAYVKENYISDDEILELIMEYLKFAQHFLSISKESLCYLKVLEKEDEHYLFKRDFLFICKSLLKKGVSEELNKIFGIKNIKEVIDIIEDELRLKNKIK